MCPRPQLTPKDAESRRGPIAKPTATRRFGSGFWITLPAGLASLLIAMPGLSQLELFRNRSRPEVSKPLP